jgi:ubiquinone/menaquinone biosynthesis C-methylase UbiE
MSVLSSPRARLQPGDGGRTGNEGGTASLRPVPFEGRALLFGAMTNSDLERVDRAYRRVGSRWAWNVLAFAGFQGWEPGLRKQTVAHLALRPGDAVLDVACGRGSNFPYLHRAVGAEGRIVGLDYSATMLAGAQELIRTKGWTNVELIQADAAQMDYRAEFDGAICTVAMTVIPRWQEALRRMAAAARPGKRVAIMDGRRASGLMRLGAPYAWLFARITAADLSRDVQAECRALLADVRADSRMFGVYFIMSGTGRPDV